MAQRIKDDPLKYFWPHQKNCNGKNCKEATIIFYTCDGKRHVIRGCPQYEFLSSQKDIKAHFGANRSGKTTVGVVETGYHLTGRYPDWWEGRRWDRPVKWRVFGNSFQKGCKVLVRKFEEWLPPDTIVAKFRNNVKVDVEWFVRHKTGGNSTMELMSYEQEADDAEGWDGDGVLFDEPPPRPIYIATVRGLVDSDGITLFTLTPLKEPWLFDEIYNSKSKDVFNVLCDIRHNLERRNPLTNQWIGLKEKAILKFEEKLTEEERETRIHGKFRYLAGRVWKSWDRDVHTFSRDRWVQGKNNVLIDGEPPSHWPRCMLIDPHDRNPMALLWFTVDEVGLSYAYREAYLPEHTIEDVVEYIRKVEMAAKERIQVRIMDPNFGPKRYSNTGITVRDEFEKSGRNLQYPVRFMFADDSKEVARKIVSENLKFNNQEPISFMNHPMWYVADDLKECIYQIEHYVWDDFKETAQGDRDPKEKVKDKNSHFPDLLQYYANSRFGWHKPVICEGVGNFYA